MKAKVRAIKALVDLCRIVMPRRPFSVSDPGRILVVTTTGIGDTLWGTPAIAALRKRHPNGYICVLTNPAGAELLKANPAIDELFVFRRGGRGFLNLTALVKSLRRGRFGIVHIFHASDRIIWPISFLTGASEITGFAGQSKDLDCILTKEISAQETLHGIDNRFRMLAEAGVEKSSEVLSFYLTVKDEQEADAFLKEEGIAPGDLIIGLHPGAQKPFKCWPAKKFAEVGNILKERCSIIITGNAAEKELAEKVSSGIDGAISAAGRLSLRGTAALINRMSLFVTNDTGPMHLAFALKTPVIAIFGPTDPKLCGPYAAENALVIKAKTTCVPCIGKKCPTPVCLEQITTQEVISAARSILDGQGTR